MAQPRAGDRAATSGSRRCTTGWPRAGAVFGTRMGWERPQRLRAPAAPARLRLGQAGLAGLVGGRAARLPRPAVAVFDQTSFSKYVVAGPGALEALQWVCAADVDVPVGQCVYTPLLNERGTYEADLTVTRDGAGRVPASSRSSATTVRDLDWLAPARRGVDGAATSTDALRRARRDGAALARAARQALDADLVEDGFPFATSREVDGRRRRRCARPG